MLVMEFVPGQSLAELLAKKGPLPVAEACHYARQVAQGLQHAFERGMVHRDIKPQNLIVTPQGQVKILDFGLAKIIRENQPNTALTAMNSYMGTPDYSAPEQATDARKADIRADLYSLGCTLYCLLAGRPPFQEDTPVKTILAHLEQEPTPLPRLRLDVPASLWAVVAKLLAKDPARRYQKPAEVAQALKPFVKTAGQPGAAPGVPPPALASPATATVVGGDTRRLKPVVPDPVDAVPAPAQSQPARTPRPRAEPEAIPVAPRRAREVPPVAQPAPATRDRHLLLLAGAAALLLFLAVGGISITLVGLWLGGAFKTKTPDGIARAPGQAGVASGEGKADTGSREPAPRAVADDAVPPTGDLKPTQPAPAPAEGNPAPEDTPPNGGNDSGDRHSAKIGDTWFEQARPAEQPKAPPAPAPMKLPAGDKKPPADEKKPGPGRMGRPDPKAPADPKSKPEATPEDDAAAERKASKKLKEVREDLFGVNQVDKLRLRMAREDLEDLIKKYPKTEAAQEAKKLLDRLNGEDP
jgi:hypothetical protein